MGLSAMDQAPATYKLWQRFSVPTQGGPKDAIAVPPGIANKLNSLYTFLLSQIILQLWAVIVLFGIYFFLQISKKPTRNGTVVHTGVWNLSKSPFDVCHLLVQYIFNSNVWEDCWPLLILWAVLAALALAGSFVLPIMVAPYIIIDNAAPVNPAAIYVPSDNSQENAYLAKAYALEVPSALRAAGSVQVANASTRAKVSVDQPEVLQDLGGGEAIIRIGYQYEVTGADFGLQHYPDLILYVKGACTTEYGWWVASIPNPPGSSFIQDYYYVFNESSFQRDVSLYDGTMPLANFYVGNVSSIGGPGNVTFAALVSSIGRLSYTPGTDPLYLTVPISNSTVGAGYTVKPARPALSCWQNDIWSYKGHNSTLTNLNSLPGLNISTGMLQNVFIRFLGEPKMVPVAMRLGASALLSASTALGEVFDAGSSSMYADLQRLVLASYIATTNMLTDTTLFPTDTNSILNYALGPDGALLSGVAEFVVWSSDISTLSVRSIIIIPTVWLALWIIVLILSGIRPLRVVQALSATVLFRHLDTHVEGWKCHSDIPSFPPKDDQECHKPYYKEDKGNRTKELGWERASSQEG